MMRAATVVMSSALIVLGCTLSRPADDLFQGGVLATFEVEGELFRTWITSPEAITALDSLETNGRPGFVPLAALQPGSGRGAHNAPWSWHLDPDVAFTPDPRAVSEVPGCDGRPSGVEEDLGAWLRRGQYCPDAATLVAIEDFR